VRYDVGRRRAIGVLLTGTAHLLNTLVRQTERHIVEVEENFTIMGYKELKHTKLAYDEMKKASKRLTAVGKNMSNN